MFLTIVSFIFVFGIIVFAHELGHFATAKWNGIHVHEFSIGMGPVLFKKQGAETLYAIRMLPIGGFVKMEGEDEASDDPRSFGSKKPFQRLVVLSAGAIMNFILAFVLLVIIMLGMGFPSNRIEAVAPDAPAEQSGMLAGDRIVSIEGEAITTWEAVTNAIHKSQGASIRIEVLRGGERLAFDVTPIQSDEGSYRIGIQTQFEKKMDRALVSAWQQFKMFFTDIFKFFTQLGNKEVQGELVGPVGIVNAIGEASRMGIWTLLILAAYISINLGIFNLLPFPALDGGRIVFVLIEWIKGKPIDREKEGYVHFVGIVILLSLMVFLVFRDIRNF